ncbi:MAG: M48 family metallopeptidase [Pseudomonadales bacterium]|nr:M48 family metallopeptidase [Pseudomonadales bacterium]
MDFFSHQDRARSSTRLLIFLFCCAVATLILMTSFLVMALLFAQDSASQEPAVALDFFASPLFARISLGVIAVVVLGSLYRLAQLRGGGKSVAEAMHGRLLTLNTRDADERKILNVVEEMAIASGLPVPPVYLIEDPAINAFAAGYHSQDAVIGVTRGCIQQLSREELQGVIAHEFSHIFNGDMRLNIHLIGLLYGIMVLGLIGFYIMHSSRYSSRRSRNGGGIIMLGLGLMVIGYGGTFFGNMIKAAVSRQREFLADASAVQFTRNPAGISGALKKIGGFKEGSRINSVDVSEVSHMLFGEGLASGFMGLFATHPPLPERIKRIDPNWQGDFAETSDQHQANMAQSAGASAFAGKSSAIDAIGNPSAGHIALAASTLAGIPEDLREEIHSTFGASAVIYSLLIESSESETVRKQLDILKLGLSADNFIELQRVLAKMRGMPRTLALPLVDLALPSLHQLSPPQYRTFMSFLSQLMVADDNISLFEWTLFKILRYNLDQSTRQRLRSVDLSRLKTECEVLFSVLAGAGHSADASRQSAFAAAAASLDLSALTYKPEYIDDMGLLDQAVDRLKHLKPLHKPRLLKAMAMCIDADGRVSPEEGELLRAVASLLDCPIPPLLAGQSFL